ncbi:MtrAB system histidine kinase MtrB [Luteipulveratus sp. YIM 133132]|uniref:MtrAB system histidine kinase MtrB n=1 Tax=Luteipulveratus flavus TaxID=3031728 RepID=UPI0023AF7708|nr:MtrAB system histidine kinase MtrB [Luteipulveratus sp. YIM 133132]MDE9367723.1 MtrAB system histidine kinase MtrB [Luteipulveratus sp. YIM 133132]
MASSAGSGHLLRTPSPGVEPTTEERLRLLLLRVRWRLGRLLRRVLRPWRRSLLVRVMTITVLLGSLVSFALGTFMYQRIADGLVDAKMRSAEQDALARLADAQNTIDSATNTDTATLQQIASDITTSLRAPDGSRLVLLRPSAYHTGVGVGTSSSDGTDPLWVPNSLGEALERDPEHQQAALTRVRTPSATDETTPSAPTVPAVVIGARVQMLTAGDYDIYFIYPMNQEVKTLDIVRNSFLLGGLVLVILLGGLAYMVTRMVVTPVRSARYVAERLSAGALNERMQARGEDDLARLATSFNAMADNLQRQIRQLEDLSEVQQRFTSDVSHELRTPLTTIRMAADMLHQGRGSFAPPVARSAELLLRELDRFESLLTDLLEISRFDAGAASLEVEEVDLGDVVRRVVESTAPLAHRNEVEVRLRATTTARAQMDQRRVERIVRNLVTNALEHAERRPVDIVVGANSSAVAVSVRDYGVGLRPGETSMVFNRFWRADPARARTTGGTGLGLSISLEDARLHHGWLQAWGDAGEGSCFRLTLPLEAGDPIKRSPTPLVDEDRAIERGVDPTAALAPGRTRDR